MGYLDQKKADEAKTENADLKKIAEEAPENQVTPEVIELKVREPEDEITVLRGKVAQYMNLSKDLEQEVKRLRVSNTRLQRNLTNLKRQQK